MLGENKRYSLTEKFQMMQGAAFEIAQKTGNEQGLTAEQGIEFVLREIKEMVGEKEKEAGYIPFSSVKDMDKKVRMKYFDIYQEMVREIFLRNNLVILDKDLQPMEREDAIYLCTSYTRPGVGPLEVYLRHPEIYTDVHVPAYNKIFYERRGTDDTFKAKEVFVSKKLFEDMCSKLAEIGGCEINVGSSKYQDFEVYKDRYSMTATGLSRNTYTFTLRIHPEEKIQFEEQLGKKIVSRKIANEMKTLIQAKRSALIGGVTGSGKTTFLSGFFDYILEGSYDKVLVCEDTHEVELEAENVVYLGCESSTKHKSGDGANYVLKDTIFMALRKKPRYILVGECRDEAFLAFVESVETGHSTTTSGHGDTERNMVNRITEKYTTACPNVTIKQAEKKLGEAHLFIGMIHNVPNVGRRLLTWTELLWDEDTERLIYNTRWRYNTKNDSWDCINKYSSELLFLVGRNMPAIYDDEAKLAWFESDNEEGGL